MRDINHQILFCNVFSELTIIDDASRMNNGGKLLCQPSLNSTKIRKNPTPWPHSILQKVQVQGRIVQHRNIVLYCLFIFYFIYRNIVYFLPCLIYVFFIYPKPILICKNSPIRTALLKLKTSNLAKKLCVRKYI